MLLIGLLYAIAIEWASGSIFLMINKSQDLKYSVAAFLEHAKMSNSKQQPSKPRHEKSKTKKMDQTHCGADEQQGQNNMAQKVKQGKKSLRKHNMKILLDTPYSVKPSLLDEAKETNIIGKFRVLVEKYPELMFPRVPGGKRKMNVTTPAIERGKKYRSELVFGINAVNRGVEKGQLVAVVISYPVKLPTLSQHIIPLCASRGCSCLFLRRFNEEVSAIFKVSSLLALGFKASTSKEFSIFHDLLMTIRDVAPNPEVVHQNLFKTDSPCVANPQESKASLHGSALIQSNSQNEMPMETETSFQNENLVTNGGNIDTSCTSIEIVGNSEPEFLKESDVLLLESDDSGIPSITIKEVFSSANLSSIEDDDTLDVNLLKLMESQTSENNSAIVSNKEDTVVLTDFQSHQNLHSLKATSSKTQATTSGVTFSDLYIKRLRTSSAQNNASSDNFLSFRCSANGELEEGYFPHRSFFNSLDELKIKVNDSASLDVLSLIRDTGEKPSQKLLTPIKLKRVWTHGKLKKKRQKRVNNK